MQSNSEVFAHPLSFQVDICVNLSINENTCVDYATVSNAALRAAMALQVQLKQFR